MDPLSVCAALSYGKADSRKVEPVSKERTSRRLARADSTQIEFDDETTYDEVIELQEIVFDPEEEETLFPEEELEE